MQTTAPACLEDQQESIIHFVEDSLDIVFHVATLFTALVLMLKVVIAPLYTNSITGTIQELIVEQLTHAREKLGTENIRDTLTLFRPMLEAQVRANAMPSLDVEVNNRWLFTYAFTLCAVLFLFFGFMLWLLRRLLGRPLCLLLVLLRHATPL